MISWLKIKLLAGWTFQWTARRSFSFASHSKNAFYDSDITFKCFLDKSLAFSSIAGRSLTKNYVRLGLWPNTNWYGQNNHNNYEGCFFTLTAHAVTTLICLLLISNINFLKFFSFSKMSFCLSTMPFDDADSAAVVFNITLNCSAMFKKEAVIRLTSIIWPSHTWRPKYGYPMFNEGIYNFFLSCLVHYSCCTKSSCIVNSLDKEKPTIGFKPCCLYLVDISHQFSISTNSFNNLSSFKLDALTNFCNFDALACLNWQCSYLATLFFFLCGFEDMSAILRRTDPPQLLSSAISTSAWFVGLIGVT